MRSVGSPSDTRPGWRRALGRAVTLTNVAVTALIALASAVLAILFQIAPTLRPDPRDSVTAEINVVAVEPGVSVDSWLQRAFVASERRSRMEAILGPEPTRSELAFEGEVVYADIEVTGFKSRHVYLRHAVYNARTHEQIPARRLGGPPMPPIPVAAPNQRSVKLLWIPSLTFDPRGRHFVRVELFDEEGLLAVDDSVLLVGGRPIRQSEQADRATAP